MPTLPTQEEFRNDLLGGEPVQLSGGVQPQAANQTGIQTLGPQAAAPSQVGESPQPTSPASPSAQPAQTGAGSLFGSSGDTASRLFSPVTQKQSSIQSGTQQLGETFRTAAGPTGQTFESRGGQEALNQAISGTFG